MKLLLAGEGKTELGGLGEHPAYDRGERGVLVTLVERFDSHEPHEPHEFEAIRWRDIKKYRAGGHQGAEARNVKGLVLTAQERRCDAVVFVRDRDRDLQRERDIEAAIADELARLEGESFAVAGGTANEAIEAWVLAACGDKDCEGHPRPKDVLEASEVHAQVEVFATADLDAVAARSRSFDRWRERVRAALRG